MESLLQALLRHGVFNATNNLVDRLVSPEAGSNCSCWRSLLTSPSRQASQDYAEHSQPYYDQETWEILIGKCTCKNPPQHAGVFLRPRLKNEVNTTPYVATWRTLAD